VWTSDRESYACLGGEEGRESVTESAPPIAKKFSPKVRKEEPREYGRIVARTRADTFGI